MKRFLVLVIVGSLLSPLLAKPMRDLPQPKFSYVDLQSKSNQKLGDGFHSIEGNNLTELPVGEQNLGGIKFKIGEGLIQLGSKVLDKMPPKIEGIKVDRLVTKLHILHATGYGGGPNKPGGDLFVANDTLIGEYRVNYEDRSAVIFPIVYGQDVRDWFYVDGEQEPSRGKVVWKGDNAFAKQVEARIRLYLNSWDNPWPNKKVTTIDYLSKMEETVAAPFCVAITVDGK